MIPSHLALDIETIPGKQLSEYSESVQAKVNEKIERQRERNPEFSYEYFASINADFGQIICISLAYVSGDEKIMLKSFYGEDELELLTKFNKVVERHKGIYIHYNGLNFDIPFILQRMMFHTLKPANFRLQNLRRFSADPHFDIMMQYYNWDMQKVLPLGVLSELQGLPSPKEELSGDKVYEAYQKKQWAKIVRYCEFDTATTLNLWWKLFNFNSVIPFENYHFSDQE